MSALGHHLLVGGNFTAVGGIACRGFAVLDATGTLTSVGDPAIDQPSFINGAVPGTTTVLVYGHFSSPYCAAARFLVTGELDTTFADPALLPVGCAVDEALADGTGYFIRGNFDTVGGVARPGFARLAGDGSVDAAYPALAEGFATAMALHDGGLLVAAGPALYRMTAAGLDGTFTTVSFDGDILSLHVLGSGKILVGGAFTLADGFSRRGLAKLDNAGQPDSSFPDLPLLNGAIYGVTAHNGGWLVYGDFTASITGASARIFRLNPDKTVDTGFSASISSGAILTAVAQPDNKILIGGTFAMSGRNRFARLLATGGLDTGFDDANFNNTVFDIALQADGKVLVAGSFGGLSELGLARLNDDGTEDVGFTPPSASPAKSAQHVVIQSTGHILVAGFFTTLGGTSKSRIARLNSDGTLDVSYTATMSSSVSALMLDSSDVATVIGANGIWERYTAAGANITLISGPRGAGVLSGDGIYSFEDSTITRLAADGSEDVTWPPLTLTLNESLVGASTGVFVTSFGTISLGGTAAGKVARLEADGTLDPTWVDPSSNGTGDWLNGQVIGLFPNTGGQVLAFLTRGGFNYVYRLAADGPLDLTWPMMAVTTDFLTTQSDGAGGVIFAMSGRVQRYDPDGLAFAGFGPVDAAMVDPHAIDTIALQADDKVLVSGTFDAIDGVDCEGFIRLNADGTHDTTFAPSLFAGTAAPHLFADGRIAMIGDFTAAGVTRTEAVGLRGNTGGYDPGFSVSLYINFISGTTVDALKFLPDGRAYVGGFFAAVGGPVGFGETGATAYGLARLMPDGTHDSTFADARLRVSTSEGVGRVYAIALQPDGKVIVGGRFEFSGGFSRPNLARFMPDGLLDAAFFGPTFSADVRAVAVQADGKVLVGGYFETVGGVATLGLVRLNVDGTHDAAFDPQLDANDFSTGVESIIALGDGKILVSGSFQQAGGVASDSCLRLNSDGTIDGTFAVGVAGTPSAMALQDDGKILLGFIGGVYRLDADGAHDPTLANAFEGAPDQIVQLAPLPDGKIACVGSIDLSGYVGVLVLNADGTIDNTFPVQAAYDSNGSDAVMAALDTVADPPVVMFPKAPGALYVGRAGSVEYPTYAGVPGYEHIAAEGAVPTGMAFVGDTVTGSPVADGMYDWRTRASDAGGGLTETDTVARVFPAQPSTGLLCFTATGVDRIAGDGTGAVQVTAYNSTPTAFQRRADGKIVIASGVIDSVGGVTRNNVALLNADGTHDVSFPGPAVAVPRAIEVVAVQPDNKILLGRVVSSVPPVLSEVVRLNADGTEDGSFTFDASIVMSSIRALVVQADGSIVVGGTRQTTTTTTTNTEGQCVRVTATGAKDATFGDPIWQKEFAGATPLFGVYYLRELADGRLVVGGSFNARNTFLGERPNTLDVISPDGAYDSTFLAQLADGDTANSALVRYVEPMSDGTFLVFGSFNFASGVAAPSGVARLSATGSLLELPPTIPDAAEIVRAVRMRDGRFQLVQAGPTGARNVRIYENGDVDGGFTSSSTGDVALVDDDGAAQADAYGGFLFEVMATGGAPDTVEELSDALVMGATATGLPTVLLRARLQLEAGQLTTWEGTAALRDVLTLDEGLLLVFRELMQVSLALGDSTKVTTTAVVQMIDALLLGGVADTELEAVALIVEALTFGALVETSNIVTLLAGLSLGDSVAHTYQAMAALVDGLLLGEAVTSQVTMVAAIRDALALGVDGTYSYEAHAVLRDGLAFVLRLAIDNQEYVAWAMNTESKGLSRYTQYPFNSFMKVGDKYYGATDTGLHLLEGADDAGAPIDAKLRLGMSSMGTRVLKRSPAMYAGYTASGDLLLKVVTASAITAEREAHAYRLIARAAGSVREGRVPIGRGLRSVYFDYQLENIDGSDFELDVIEFLPLTLERRVRGNSGGKR